MRAAYRTKLNAMTPARAGLRPALAAMAGRLFPALPRRAGGGVFPPAAGAPVRPGPRRGKSGERLSPGSGSESGFSAPRTGKPAEAEILIDSHSPGRDMRRNPSITPNDVPTSRDSARADVLVSNIGQTHSSGSHVFQSQPFTTGSNDGGYRLTSVELAITTQVTHGQVRPLVGLLRPAVRLSTTTAPALRPAHKLAAVLRPVRGAGRLFANERTQPWRLRARDFAR